MNEMYRAEYSSWRGVEIKEITPEKVTEKTVTVNGRRENKESHSYGHIKWFDEKVEAIVWLTNLAVNAKKNAQGKVLQRQIN